MSVKHEYLVAARDMLQNSKVNLCHAISAFEQSGGEFEKTIEQAKTTIGDIECSIYKLDEYLSQR